MGDVTESVAALESDAVNAASAAKEAEISAENAALAAAQVQTIANADATAQFEETIFKVNENERGLEWSRQKLLELETLMKTLINRLETLENREAKPLELILSTPPATAPQKEVEDALQAEKIILVETQVPPMVGKKRKVNLL